MFVWTMFLYKYMKLHRNDVHHLSDSTHGILIIVYKWVLGCELESIVLSMSSEVSDFHHSAIHTPPLYLKFSLYRIQIC
jgi:hypothetical protein